MMELQKRIFDVTTCLLLAMPASVIVLLTLPFVWIDTNASPIFQQRRIGRNGRLFTMVKLRTMHAHAPNRASHEVDHAMITWLGRILRKTKIDELPQLWNVLRGDMSLVGPRPCLPSQVQLIEERTRLGVLSLRPGITGIAQLQGLDMSEPVALAHADAAYLSPWSLRRDMLLLIKTASGKGNGDAVMTGR